MYSCLPICAICSISFKDMFIFPFFCFPDPPWLLQVEHECVIQSGLFKFDPVTSSWIPFLPPPLSLGTLSIDPDALSDNQRKNHPTLFFSTSSPLLRLAQSQPRCIPLPAATSASPLQPSKDIIKLQAYITPDFRWNQTLWMQQQQLVQTSEGTAVMGSTWAGGTLSLEAVHLGRRCPVTLRFNDGDAASIGPLGYIESTGSTGPSPAGSIDGSESGSHRDSGDAGEGGLQAVTLEVDLSGGSGMEDLGGVFPTGGGSEVVVSPGMLRINVWCSWNKGEHHSSVGISDGGCESPSTGRTLASSAYHASSDRRSDATGAPHHHVSLPDVLMASEQVVLLPSLWATGASDLSSALKKESAMVLSGGGGEDPAVSAEMDLDFDMRSGHRSKALVDVGLVVEAVFATEERLQPLDASSADCERVSCGPSHAGGVPR